MDIRNVVQGYVPLGLTAVLMAGCAGPATPLGAPWATNSAQVKNGPLSFIASLFNFSGRSPAAANASVSDIRFYPARQVLHRSSPMTVIIDDLNGVRANYKVVVRYNGIDVTPSFMRQAKIDFRDDGRQLVIRVPTVRLNPKKEHHIEVVYGNGANLSSYARFNPPVCRALDHKNILTTDVFTPDSELVTLIQNVAKQTGFSPAFTAALIAQESSFNPRTVSWARAIGLTQVTPVADQELAKKHSEWPRYPGLNELPLAWMKMLILSGAANEDNEWRLNPRHSIRGGLTYAQMLVERWNEPQNLSRVKTSFEDPQAELTKLVLASYNSGYARVQGAFTRMGRNWLTAPELNEARNYVNRIFSLCDHFSHAEVDYENET